MEPSLWSDALNKFSQLTPWVQVATMTLLSATVLGIAYFFKETVRVLMPRRGEEDTSQ